MSGPWEDFQTSAVATDRKTGSVERVPTGPWDDFKAAPQAGPWEDFAGVEQPQTGLFSTAGVKSIGETLGPRIARGYHGYMLSGLEEIQNAREKARARGQPVPIDPEEQQRLEDIRKRRDTVQRLNEEIRRASPANPSYPLELATGAVQSVATMAPGIAAGVGTGRILGGPVAMIPGLMMAESSQRGQSYAEHRVPEDIRKQAAPIEEALINAKVAGLTEAAFEILPTTKLISEVGKVGLTRLIRNYMMREYATEIPTTVAQDLTEWATVEKDMPLGDFLKKVRSDVIDTALTVPLVAGAGSTLAKIQSKAGLALEPAGQQTMGPSGEMIPVSILDTYRNVPPPVPTQQPDPAATATIAEIDATLNPADIKPEDLAAARKTVQDYDALRTAAPIVPETLQTLDGLDDLLSREDVGEIGESAAVARNARLYRNENDEKPRSEREILYGPTGEGLQLRQTQLTTGTYTVGIPTADRSAETLRAYHDTIEEWRAKFMPNATVLLMNESLPTDSAVGWHSRLASGVHVITPAAIRSMKSSATFNTNAQAKAFSNLAHEFGHALVFERFFEGVDPGLAMQVRMGANMGVIDEALIAQVADPLKQAVLREFNAIKQEVMSGSMTTADFQTRWMNPAKIHKFSLAKEHYTPLNAPALQMIDSILGRAYRNTRGLDAMALHKLRNEYLGLDEYLAEQTARYAYQKEWDVNAPASMQNLIGRALQSVRQALNDFFKMLKKDGTLTSGVRFQEWLDSLSKDPLHGLPNEKVGKRKATKKGGKPAAASKRVVAKPKEEEVPELDHNKFSASADRQRVARSAVAGLVKDGTLEANGEKYKELMALIKAQDFDTFTDEMQPYIESKVKFEIDDFTEEQYEAAFGMPPTVDPTYFSMMVNEVLAKANRFQTFLGGLPPTWEPNLLSIELADRTNTWPVQLSLNGGLTIFGKEEAHEWLRNVEAYLDANLQEQDKVIEGAEDPPTISLSPKAGDLTPSNKPQPTGTALQLHDKLFTLGYSWYVEADELILWKEGPSGLAEEVPYEQQPPEIQQIASELAEIILSKPHADFVVPPPQKHIEQVHAAAGNPGVPYWLQQPRTELTEQEAHDPSTLADAAFEWKKHGFASKYVKAWFGDWQNDPANASKVVNANGEPLIQYHGTDADFTIFDRGDIGFHFGTLRAAHNRMYGFSAHTQLNEIHEHLMLNPAKNLTGAKANVQFLPVILNIKNPLDIGSEGDGSFWTAPAPALRFLWQRKIITEQEYQETLKQVRNHENFGPSRRQGFLPVRALLMEKGYDGIKYENTIEGDTSWVAFNPDQIKSVLGSRTFSKSPHIHFELDFDEAKSDGYSASRFLKKIGALLPAPARAQLRRTLRFVTNLQFKGLQLQQLAHLNPDLDDLSFMVEKNLEYERFKGELQGGPAAVGERWKNLGKENHAKVNRFLQAEMDGGALWVDLVKEGENWVYRPNALFLEKLKEYGINTDTKQGEELGELIIDVKNSLLTHINQAEKVLSYLAGRRYGTRPDILRARIVEIRDAVHKLRQQPFLPQGRFGNHMLTIERKKSAGPGWEVVYREAFDTREDREMARGRMEKGRKPDERIKSHDLSDSAYVMMSLPQDFLDAVISELGLTQAQRDQLYDLLIPVKRERLLGAYDRDRLGIAGASKDVLRSYSNFIWHNSNLLAKTRYRADFNLAIQGMNTLLRKAQLDGSEELINKYGELHRYMQRTRDAVMHPANEAYLLRSIVALSYLAYNVKTALLNLYGLVTTWSDINTRIGEVAGDALLGRASAATFRSINPFDLNARRKGDYLPPDWSKALDRAILEGQLTQSYAYHIAGMANASNLHRMPGRDIGGKAWRNFVDLGMWVFRLTELSTRRITFLAQFELASREKDATFEIAYQEAISRTNKLQNDYSMGNRAPFLRGWQGPGGSIVPLATVFMSFTQHMAFHAFGGYELGLRRTDRKEGRSPRKVHQSYTLRIVLLTLLLAGYEGLPGAENILDLVDAVWKKWFGKPARQEIREDLRELVRSVSGFDSDPLLLAHGLGHNIAGFDVSRSVGLGRMVPGTDALAKSSGADFKADIGALALNILGPTGGMIEWMLKTGFGKGGFDEGMKRAPGAIGNVWNAYQWDAHGVRAPSGAEVTRDTKTGELRDLTTAEIFGKALGFNPTVVSQNREILFAQHDARMYWMGRRERLLDDIWKATYQGDREAIADVRKNIDEFNEEIPEEYRTSLRITPKQLADSRKVRQKNMRLEERGLPVQKRYRPLYRDVRESYGPGPVEREP